MQLGYLCGLSGDLPRSYNWLSLPSQDDAASGHSGHVLSYLGGVSGSDEEAALGYHRQRDILMATTEQTLCFTMVLFSIVQYPARILASGQSTSRVA